MTKVMAYDHLDGFSLCAGAASCEGGLDGARALSATVAVRILGIACSRQGHLLFDSESLVVCVKMRAVRHASVGHDREDFCRERIRVAREGVEVIQLGLDYEGHLGS
jgi:hypothetical protein